MKLVRALVAALAAVLALAGCAQNPNNVAVVNGSVVTNAQALDLATAVATYQGTPERATELLTSAVGVLVQLEVAQHVGAAAGITITDAERAATMESSDEMTKLLADPVLGPYLNRSADASLIQQKLGTDAYLAAAAAVPVQLNPRFGTWDAEQQALSGDSGSISTPAVRS